jgi:hypothetical protein
MIFLNNIFSQIEIDADELNIPQQTGGIDSNIANIIEITIIVFGAVAMLIIIYAGIQFMLSQGDSAKATTARNTIIYAAIGLAITVLAFSIVSFVTGRF